MKPKSEPRQAGKAPFKKRITTETILCSLKMCLMMKTLKNGSKAIPNVLVNLDSTVGSEMKKTRLYVVISPNEMNTYLQTIVLAPVTSSPKNYPTRVEINHDKKQGWIVLDQIRTVNKLRILKVLGNLQEKEVLKVKNIFRETYVD